MLFLIAMLIVAVFAVIIAIQNVVPVSVTFLFWKFENISLSLAMLLPLSLGFVIGMFIVIPAAIKRKLMISSQQKRIRDLEKDLQKKEEPKQ